MPNISWLVVYGSDLQSVYTLLVVPIAFLAYRLVVRPDPACAARPAAARFVSWMTIIFAVETMIDPIATGPFLEHLALAPDSLAASAIPFVFVYLGDLRVLWLAIGVARPEAGVGANLFWAARTASIVPLVAGGAYALVLRSSPEAPMATLWMLYELGFLVLCVYLGRIWVAVHLASEPESAAYLRALLGYSAAYYALWLGADILINVGGLDLGWALRIVPNQLYYAFWAPFAYLRFFSCPRENARR